MGVEQAKLLLAKAKDDSEGMKDSNIPLNYGAQELEDAMETAKRLGILE